MNDSNTVEYDAKIMLTDTLGMRPDTNLAHRILCDLIFATGEGPLDFDDALASLTCAPVGSWARIKGELIQKGWKVENGRLTHGGAQNLAQKSLDAALRLSEAGRLGASARWGRGSPPDGDANAVASEPECGRNAVASEPECGRNAIGMPLVQGSKVQVQGSDKGSDQAYQKPCTEKGARGENQIRLACRH